MSRVILISNMIPAMLPMFFLIFMIVSIMLGLKIWFLLLSDMLGFVINLVSIMPRILLLLCFNINMNMIMIIIVIMNIIILMMIILFIIIIHDIDFYYYVAWYLFLLLDHTFLCMFKGNFVLLITLNKIINNLV